MCGSSANHFDVRYMLSRPVQNLDDFVSPSMTSTSNGGPSAPPVQLVIPRESQAPSAPEKSQSAPSGLGSNQTLSQQEPDFDALSKRFDSLRKRGQ